MISRENTALALARKTANTQPGSGLSARTINPVPSGNAWESWIAALDSAGPSTSTTISSGATWKIRSREIPGLVVTRTSATVAAIAANELRRCEEAAITMTCSELSPRVPMGEELLRPCSERQAGGAQCAAPNELEFDRLAHLECVQNLLHRIRFRYRLAFDLNQHVPQKHAAFFRWTSRLHVGH